MSRTDILDFLESIIIYFIFNSICNAKVQLIYMTKVRRQWHPVIVDIFAAAYKYIYISARKMAPFPILCKDDLLRLEIFSQVCNL